MPTAADGRLDIEQDHDPRFSALDGRTPRQSASETAWTGQRLSSITILASSIALCVTCRPKERVYLSAVLSAFRIGLICESTEMARAIRRK